MTGSLVGQATKQTREHKKQKENLKHYQSSSW
jgi:hypothetical protein